MRKHTRVLLITAIAVLAVLPTISLAASQNAEGLLVTHQLGETMVPYNPQRVIVFDFGALDTLDALGIDVVGVPKGGVIPSYLSKFADDKYASVGSLVEPNLDRIYALKPDLIIISGRQSTYYDELQQIAPTIYLGVDTSRYMESFRENARTIERIFQREDDVETIIKQVDQAVADLRDQVQASPSTALVVLVNDKAISAYGPGSRFGLIHDVFGFTAASEGIVASTHGMSISFEFILSHDPDYLFVVDRTAVVAGTSSAKQVIENQLIRYTKAYKNGNIVYLNPEYWYLSGGGLVSVPAMVDEVAAAVK